ncbi:hypothetical protein [Brevundimonas sp.]
MLRDTNYATEIATVTDELGQRIERIHVKDRDRPEIRFSWWPNGKMAVRPLDIPEDELLALMRQAIRKNVFSSEFLKGLHEALYDDKQGEIDA